MGQSAADLRDGRHFVRLVNQLLKSRRTRQFWDQTALDAGSVAAGSRILQIATGQSHPNLLLHEFGRQHTARKSGMKRLLAKTSSTAAARSLLYKATARQTCIKTLRFGFACSLGSLERPCAQWGSRMQVAAMESNRMAAQRATSSRK